MTPSEHSRPGAHRIACLFFCFLMAASIIVDCFVPSSAFADECPAGGNHDFLATIITQPTDTADGQRRFTCSKCGYSYVAIIPSTGHHWGEWYVVLEPTCTSEGIEERVCSDCGMVDQELLPMLSSTGDHVWAETSRSEPTCTDEGWAEYRCTICGQTKVDTLPALNHSWSDWYVKTPATDTSEGIEERSCTRCGELDQVLIPMLATAEREEGDQADPAGVQPQKESAPAESPAARVLREFFTGGADNVTPFLFGGVILAAVVIACLGFPFFFAYRRLRRQRKLRQERLPESIGHARYQVGDGGTK